MTVLKQYNSGTSQWEPIVTGTIGATGPTGVTGPTGPTGPLGITSSATAPVSPSSGQVWFNTTTGASYIYYNSAWVELGGGTMSPYQATSSTRPSSPWTGQHVYETDTSLEYVYNGSSWVLLPTTVSPAFTGTPTAPTAVFYTNSTQLATTAFVTTALNYNADGYRNLFINGGLAVDQRGMATSHTVTAGAALSYTVDRWYEYCTGANVTAARLAFSPTLGASQNPYYYYQFTGATSNTLVGFGQRIETANLFGTSAGYCTISSRMWASTSKTVTWTAYTANTTDTFGTLASPTRTSVATGTFSVTTTPTDFSAYLGPLPSSVTGLEIVFTCPTLTSGQTISFSNMQLEKGLKLTATPFEQRPIGTELALCQRYFVGACQGWTGRIGGTTNAEMVGRFPVPMRATPTLTFGGFSGAQTEISQIGVGAVTATAITSFVGTNEGGYTAHTISGGTNASFAAIRLGSTCAASAEL